MVVNGAISETQGNLQGKEKKVKCYLLSVVEWVMPVQAESTWAGIRIWALKGSYQQRRAT